MQRPFSQGLIITIVFLASISIINTRNIYAGTLREEAEAYREQGYQSQERGDIDIAMSLYQKAINLDPEYAAPHNDLGILFEAKGWLDRAETSYQKALSIDPDYEKAHTNLALLYERKGELEKAAFHWMRRYKLGKPGEPWTEEARQRLEKLGLIDEEEAKRIEIEKAPPAAAIKKETRKKTGTGGWTKIGASKKKQTAPKKRTDVSRKKDLEAQLQESLRLAEERLRREKREKPEAGKKEYKKTESDFSARTSTSDAGAKNYYVKADSYYKKGEYSRALDTIRTAKKDYPEDRDLLELEQAIKNKMKEERIEDHYNEGIMNYRQKDYSGARREFEAILNILPE